MDLNSPSTPSIDQFKTITPASTYSRLAMPLTRWYSAAAETTRSAIVPMAAPIVVASPGTTPVDAAVQALGQLTRMHADRDGESTDPHGWQPVSDRDGLKIEKRIVNHVSETFPVFRAGRIIEGFTAEEVSASVSVLQKDERFEKPHQLQSYGPSITTSHMTAHTTFPFRGRSVLVASIVARLPDGPPPSPSVNGHTAVSTILHASTSSFDPQTLGLDISKYNPSILPSATVILEGWILETIDPYSHEQYAIPSTRCMYVGAVDYSGSMPFSVNNMLNVSLPRALLTVEMNLKSRGPPSRARSPAMMVIGPDISAQGPWSLEGIEGERIGVASKNDEEGFSLTVVAQPTAAPKDTDGTLSPMTPGLRHTESKVSVNSSRSTVIDLGEDIRRGRQDLVVAEVEIGANLAKSGCDIEASGFSLPASQISMKGDSVLPLKLPPPVLDLPFKVSVVVLAPSVLQSASLDPNQVMRHLLRVTLPTAGYEPSIDDPLSGRTTPLPRPRWLLDLLNDGAAIQISLKPGSPGYHYKGDEVSVEDDKPARGGKELRGSPKLVPRSTRDSSSLERPLAVADWCLLDQPTTVAVTANGDGAGDSTFVASTPTLPEVVS